MLDKYFDKVYVITTFNSERIEYCKKQLEKAGVKKYEFVTSIDYRIIDREFKTIVHPDCPAQKYMSLCSNHIGIVQSAIYNGYNNICICEDDIFFKDDYQSKLKDFMKNIPDNWDMLNLGYLNEDNQLEIVNEYVYKQVGKYWGAHCVAYKNTIYLDLINIYYKFSFNISPDWFGRELCSIKNIYIPQEKFIYQVSRDYADYSLNRANSDVMFNSMLHNVPTPSYYFPQK